MKTHKESISRKSELRSEFDTPDIGEMKTENWEKLFNESWRIIRENRTCGPKNIFSTPTVSTYLNEAKYKDYQIILTVTSSAMSAHGINYNLSILKNNETLVEIHHIDGAHTGDEKTILTLLEEFGDTGFDPWK